jgi:RHS repeat-associated protein
MGRLATVTKDGALAEAYSYDAAGNRTGETSTALGITRSSTYDSEDHLLTAGADTYAFSADGFLTTRHTAEGTSTFDYSTRGELLSAALPDGRTVSYDYDPLGRRIAKRIDGNLTEKYLWANATTLLAVLAPDGSIRQRFTYADDRVPLSVETSSGTYYLSCDQVGSLRTVADASGSPVKEITYDSFGNVISDSNPAFRLPFGFAGGLADADTGLTKFGARDYDPATGRWTAKDPIDFAGGDANLYGYCLGDPVGWVDSDGLWGRWPDYLGGNVNIAIPTPYTGTLIGWSGTFSVDRYGHWYYSPLGATIGKSWTVVSGSVTANWVNQPCKPGERQLRDFQSGHGFNAAGGYWAGVSETWSPGNGTATGAGFVTPQIGASYNYSFEGPGKTGLAW